MQVYQIDDVLKRFFKINCSDSTINNVEISINYTTGRNVTNGHIAPGSLTIIYH